MKTILLTLVLPLLITVGFAPQAAAQHCSSRSQTYVSGRSHCGCPVYSQRYVAYYNHCGQPVFRVRVLPVQHRCHSRVIRRGCNTPSYGHGNRHGGSYRRGTSFRSNRHLQSAIVPARLPHITFSPGRSIHVGFGLR